MILAVNTESFLTLTYEEATAVLRQLTGDIRFLVMLPAEEMEKRTKEKEEKKSPSKNAESKWKRVMCTLVG